MNTIKVDFTNEDILTGLYKLASIGAAKSLNVDLMKLEELSGRKLELSGVCVLALAGAETDEEKAFANACLSAS
jgi:hypothetical protein